MKIRLASLILFLGVAVATEAAIPLRPVTIPQDTVTAMKTDTIARQDTTALFKELGEVVVEGSVVQRRGNEDVWTITQKMRENTNNAGELLGKIQGAYYDPVSRELSYMGSKNIIILVDSIEKDQGYVKRLGQNRFEQVGVILNPQGKYAGYSALINLKTKPHYEGYEGNAYVQLRTIPTGANGRGNGIYNAEIDPDFTWTRDKITIAFTGKAQRVRKGNEESYAAIYPMNDYSRRIIDNAYHDPNTINTTKFLSGTLSADWQINNRHSMSASFTAQYNGTRNIANLRIAEGALSRSEELITDENRKTLSKETPSLRGGLWYRGQIGSWSVSASAMASRRTIDRRYSLLRNTGFSLTDDRDVVNSYVWGGADASRWFANNKFMLQISDYITVSDYKEETPLLKALLSRSSNLYNNALVSMWWMASQRVSLGLAAGIGTQRQAVAGLPSNTYTSPRVAVAAAGIVNNNLSLRFNYDMSSIMPPISMVQNYGQFTDSLMWQGGNPDLKPSLNHTFRLVAYIMKWLTVSGSLTLGHNQFYNIYLPGYGLIPGGGETYYAESTFANGTSTSWNINATLNVPVGKKFRIMGDVGVSGVRGSWNSYSSDKALPSGSVGLSYTPTNNWNIVFSENISSSLNISPQQKQWGTSDFMTLYVGRYLLKRNLQVALSWFLPVHLLNCETKGGIRSDIYRTTVCDNNIRRENNTLMLQIVYSLQRGKAVRKYQRQEGTVNL